MNAGFQGNVGVGPVSPTSAASGWRCAGAILGGLLLGGLEGASAGSVVPGIGTVGGGIIGAIGGGISGAAMGC